VKTKEAVKEIEKKDAEHVEETPLLLEEIHLEKITIDGICGVY
jgi:mycofactocin precursor